MKHQTNPQPKSLTHIYVRDAHKGFVRPCWTSGQELYCGICMEGLVEAEIGSVCPLCESVVERIIEVSDGGKPLFLGGSPNYASPLRQQAETKRKSGALSFKGSQKILA